MNIIGYNGAIIAGSIISAFVIKSLVDTCRGKPAVKIAEDNNIVLETIALYDREAELAETNLFIVTYA